MDLRLQGKVAIVTGASRGIGLAIAQGLAEEGVKLCLAARGEKDLAAAATQIEASGGEALAIPTDMADAAVWLVSERAAWVNGTSLGVDGGQSKSIR